LPFAAGAFDLVVREGGLPGSTGDAGYDLAECARVSRGEVILVADNRFGYKRSAGAHGAFHVLGPLEYTGAVASPARGQRSLWGYRRALARAGLPEAEPYALYPHSGQFVHVVALDRPRPRLPIGPKERANRLKILGARLGLFPVLTPSFALFAARAPARGPRRVERILAELCARIGEGPAEVDQLVATRGNTAVLLTRAAGERGDDESPAGRYCLHLPLCPYQQRLCERHAEALPRLAAERPRVPVPELFFAGAIEGAYVTCERRLAGHTAPDISDEPAVAERMLAEVAELAAALALGPPRVLDEAAFAELVEAKFELVLRHAAVPATLSRVRELRARARAELLGRRLPRVRYHADLRGKHVQIDRKGGVLGILDWGTLEDEGLPYVDLLHLVVHERKQAESLTAGAAWRRVTSPGRLARERSARERYAAALGLEPDYLDLVEAIYPVLVAAMAESHWDYSRPRWVHTQFEL
jgi:aminoglycoside phosphotransferase (APT) family kinase protein